MPSHKEIITLTVSEALKAKIDTEAVKDKVANAEWIRRAICKVLGHPIALETVQRGKPRKYNTKEERLAAQKAARQETQALAKRLLAEHRAKIKAQAISALENSLEGKANRIPDDTPKPTTKTNKSKGKAN